MGRVVKFPGVRRRARRGKSPERKTGSATVIILPVVRIERYTDQPFEPEPLHATGRRRRPRA
jgi:hypothetical protein